MLDTPLFTQSPCCCTLSDRTAQPLLEKPTVAQCVKRCPLLWTPKFNRQEPAPKDRIILNETNPLNPPPQKKFFIYTFVFPFTCWFSD
jgi:hypothetical protein